MTDTPGSAKGDLIDRLRKQWKQENPELDTSAMEVVGRITLLASRWDSDLQKALKPYGLMYTDFDILATLYRTGTPYELTPTELLESVILTSGAMTTALTRLEKSGLLSRTEDSQDRRIRPAKLTGKGVSLAVEAAEVRFQKANEQLSQLNRRDRKVIAGLLKNLI